jgi:hypothetical protein
MNAPCQPGDGTSPPSEKLVTDGQALAGDDGPQEHTLEQQIRTLAKLLPLLRGIRNAGHQKREP